VFNPRYDAQVRLLLRCLPEIGRYPCFALKGGTAINLFVQDLPRISVDIDLTYLPLKPRREALQEIHGALRTLKADIEEHVSGSRVREVQNQGYIVKLIVSTNDAMVKIEPNLILRGSVHAPEERDLCLTAQEHFGAFVSVRTLSTADLYGGIRGLLLRFGGPLSSTCPGTIDRSMSFWSPGFGILRDSTWIS